MLPASHKIFLLLSQIFIWNKVFPGFMALFDKIGQKCTLYGNLREVHSIDMIEVGASTKREFTCVQQRASQAPRLTIFPLSTNHDTNGSGWINRLLKARERGNRCSIIKWQNLRPKYAVKIRISIDPIISVKESGPRAGICSSAARQSLRVN